MSHSNSDRIAFNKHQAQVQQQQEITQWLRSNPEVGVLNSGVFYVIRNGQQVNVAALSHI